MAECLSKKLLSEDRLFESFARINRIASTRLRKSTVTTLPHEIFAKHAQLAAELR
jgi:hypothetical protein